MILANPTHVNAMSALGHFLPNQCPATDVFFRACRPLGFRRTKHTGMHASTQWHACIYTEACAIRTDTRTHPHVFYRPFNRQPPQRTASPPIHHQRPLPASTPTLLQAVSVSQGSVQAVIVSQGSFQAVSRQ